MEVEIIANCKKCNQRFLIKKKASLSFASAYNSEYAAIEFDDKKGPLTYHKYLKKLDRDSFYVSTRYSKQTALCKSCDADYWENFDRAVKTLESFWHEPLE